MQSTFYAIAAVLGLVALSSFAYAGYMFSEGRGADALPLIITATVNLGMIAILSTVLRKKQE